jgi:hypothetical protein
MFDYLRAKKGLMQIVGTKINHLLEDSMVF